MADVRPKGMCRARSAQRGANQGRRRHRTRTSGVQSRTEITKVTAETNKTENRREKPMNPKVRFLQRSVEVMKLLTDWSGNRRGLILSPGAREAVSVEIPGRVRG